MKRGFTLIEMITVFILLGIIASIAFPSINKIKAESAKKTFTESAKGVISAAQTYYAENEYKNYPEEGINITDGTIKVKNQNIYKRGIILYNSSTNQFELEDLSDGNYCANGTSDNLEIVEGDCTTK